MCTICLLQNAYLSVLCNRKMKSSPLRSFILLNKQRREGQIIVLSWVFQQFSSKTVFMEILSSPLQSVTADHRAHLGVLKNADVSSPPLEILVQLVQGLVGQWILRSSPQWFQCASPKLRITVRSEASLGSPPAQVVEAATVVQWSETVLGWHSPGNINLTSSLGNGSPSQLQTIQHHQSRRVAGSHLGWIKVWYLWSDHQEAWLGEIGFSQTTKAAERAAWWRGLVRLALPNLMGWWSQHSHWKLPAS